MTKLFIKLTIKWCVWGVFAMAGTVLWQYLEDIGFLYVAEGRDAWNGRKVIFSLVSFLFFVLAIAKSAVTIGDYSEPTE
jgi:hypothetical protein